MIHLFRISTLRNVFWTAGGNAFMSATSFIASIFVIRNLGPSEYGVLQEFIAVFSVIQVFENIINPNLFKRELINHPSEQAEFISAIGLLISIFSFVLTLVLAALIIFGALDSQYWLLLVMLIGSIFRITNGISFYFDAHLKSFKSQISLNVGNSVSSFYKIIASYAVPSAFLQAVAFPVLYFVTAIVHFFQFKSELTWKIPSKKTIHHLLVVARESLPVFFSTLVEIFKTRLPLIFLGFFAIPSDLGVYGAGVKLVEPWSFIASALSISFWPKLLTSRKESGEKFRTFVDVFFATTFYIFMPISLVSILFGEFAINLLLGPVYVSAIPVFQIHALILLITVTTQAINLVDLSQGMGKVIFTRNVVSLGFIALTILPFFNQLGITGVAWSILVSNALTLIILPIFHAPSRGALSQYGRMMTRGPVVIFKEYQKRSHA